MLILCFWYKPHSPSKAEHDFCWCQQKLCLCIKGRADCAPTEMSRVGRANLEAGEQTVSQLGWKLPSECQKIAAFCLNA